MSANNAVPSNNAPSQQAPGSTRKPGQAGPPTRPPTPPATNRGTPGGLDPWALLGALRRRWLLATILAVLVGGAVGAAVWSFLPPGHHTATRVLHVAATPSGVLDPSRGGADFPTFKQTQVALIRSRVVLNTALRSPKVAQGDWLKQVRDPLEWLEKEVRVSFPSSPEIMHISLAGTAEQVPTLTILVDGVTDAYLSEIVEKEHQRLLKRTEQLREIAARFEKKVKAIRLSMKTLREQAGTGKPDNVVLKQNLALREHELAVQELTRLRSEVRTVRSSLDQAVKGKAEDDRSVTEEAVAQALARDTVLAQMKAEAVQLDQLIDREAEKAPKGRGYPHPVLDPLEAKLKGQQAEVRRREGEVRQLVTAQAHQEHKRNAGLGLLGMRQKLEHLEGLEKLLVKDCERLARESKQLNITAVNLEDFNHELAEAEAMRAALTRKAEMLAIEAEAPPRINRLDQEAVVKAPDERMRKVRFAGLACLAAVGVVVLGIGLLELSAQRVTSPTAVARDVGLNVVGTLPYYRANKGGERAAQRLRELVDNARTLLLHQAEGKGIQAVMVTSASSAEGKTSLACHLAASLARAGRRTLLLDADLRKPDAHNIFGGPEAAAHPGLCEAFRGECTVWEAVREVDVPGLRLLPAGRCDDRALRALAQTAFAAVLGQLRQEYDFIIVDTSPVLEVPDALMLGRHVDGVLFAVMQGETRTNRLATAAERFASLDAPILGMIVSGADDDDAYGAGPYARSFQACTPATRKQAEGRS